MGGVAEKLCFKSHNQKLNRETPANFFDFKIKDIDGNVIDFDRFRGKKAIIIVNVASK